MKKSDKQTKTPGPEEKRKKDIEDTLSSIDLSTLKTCLSIYNKIKSDGPRYLNEFENELEIDNATIHRRVTRLEDAMATLLGKEQPDGMTQAKVKFQLLERQRGAKARIPADEWLRQEVESIFFNIQEIVNAWDRLAHRWGAGEVVVRIATTLSAARFIVPNLLRVEELKDVWFDVTQTKSSRLLEMARAETGDLILTDVPRDFQESEIANVFKFNLAIIAPRGHVLEHELHVADLELKDILKKLVESGTSLCLLPEDPSLFPLPDYPDPSNFPKDLRVLRAGSTTLCQSLVMNSHINSSVVAITGTQFLTEDDLERLVIIELPANQKQAKPNHMALIRPGKTRPIFNISRTKAIDAAEAAILEMLREATMTRSDCHYWIYHTTRIRDQNVWARGKLSWRPRTPSSDSKNQSRVQVLTGTHTMLGVREGLSYVVRGRAVQNDGDSHVTYRARSVGGIVEDSYVFSGFCPSFGNMKAGPIVGVWNGVFSRADKPRGQKHFLPGAGFAVITDEQNVDVEYLNNLAESCRVKYKTAEIILAADQFQEQFELQSRTRKLDTDAINIAGKKTRPQK